MVWVTHPPTTLSRLSIRSALQEDKNISSVFLLPLFALSKIRMTSEATSE